MRNAALIQFFAHAIHADFVQLIDSNQSITLLGGRNASSFHQAAQDTAVIEAQIEGAGVAKAKFLQNLRASG